MPQSPGFSPGLRHAVYVPPAVILADARAYRPEKLLTPLGAFTPDFFKGHGGFHHTPPFPLPIYAPMLQDDFAVPSASAFLKR